MQVEERIRRWLRGFEKLVVVGIGNPLRRDDYVGLKITEELNRKIREEWVLILLCESNPESLAQPIIEYGPSHVLLIDAAMLGLPAGEAKLIPASSITDYPTVSSHTLPLKIFCQQLEMLVDVDIALLAIQPGDTSFGEGLTSRVYKTAWNMADALVRVLKEMKK